MIDYAKTFVDNEKKENREYDHVWLVYDLDDFPSDDFDNTDYFVGAMNESLEYPEKWHAAWSNQCFELWFLLHFNYYNTDIHRDEYFEKLSEIFKSYNLDKYEKNNKDIFEILIKYEDNAIDNAIRNAKRLCKENEGQPPSKMAPATKVYELVEILKPHMLF